MTRGRLIFSSLTHHARSHLGTLLGVVVASAVLIGALVVGDSVRFSLRQQALNRLGGVRLALVQHDRFFRDALADELQLAEGITVAPVLHLQSSAMAGGKGQTRRAPSVQLLGVDDRFWKIARPNVDAPKLQMDDSDVIEVFVNDELAKRLRLGKDSKFTVHVAKPSLLPRDVPLAVEGEFDDLVGKLTLRVKGILASESLGNFSLRPDPIPPFNVFLPINHLQEMAGKQGRRKPSLMQGLAKDNGLPELPMPRA